MQPKPFTPQICQDDPRFVKNLADGFIWHRSHYRTLYADTDRSAVVYHANYLRYFEFGRTSLMRDMSYPYSEIEASGYVYPIIEIGVKYYSPLHYDDPMWVHTRPGDLERVRLKFHYIITHGETGRIVCMGFTEHCALNSAGKPVAIDERTKHLWEIFPK
ncbi:MAG: acyl-CoA thioesterase [Desulfobacteraceae bacterium]|nr:acyl-CoA thioesterase [Desulfobacteraceae bacterium]MCF8094575.1 acyl-CoA thioesterase [Desulfobacteraceae bacterium]